jgi:assimilatory nitrate reductase catalytic subunit
MRTCLLAGQQAGHLAASDAGRTICACFGIGLRTLHQTIASRRLTSVGEIGVALRAGTNCGSCIPELRAILRDVAPGGITAALPLSGEVLR